MWSRGRGPGADGVLAHGMSMDRGVAIGGLLAAAVTGVATAHGGRLSYLLLAVEAGAALFVIIERLGAMSLRIWAVATPLLFPFLRLPADHPLVTFDRVWVLAALSCVLVSRRRISGSRASRLMIFTFSWLALVFGLRAIATKGPNLGFDAVTLWLDAVILPFVLFVAAAKLTPTPAEARRLMGALALAGVCLACLGLAQKVAGFELASRSGGAPRFDDAIGTVRISGPYPAPEPFALSLLICLAATLYWIQARRPRPYLLGGLAVVLECTAIGFTFFRAAWITGIVVLVVMLIRPRRPARTLLVVVYAVAITALAFTRLEDDPRFANRVHNARNLDTRLAAYGQALDIFELQPLYGVGVDQYPIVAASLPQKTFHGVAPVPNPHNSFLGVLAEQGVLGLAPLLASSFAVWFALGRFRRRMTDADDVLLFTCARGAAVAYALMSLPLNMFPYGSTNAFLGLVLGAACGRYEALGHAPTATATTPYDAVRS
jgi:O-antigen ligase